MVRGPQSLRIPPGVDATIIRKPPMTVIDDPQSAVSNAIGQSGRGRLGQGIRCGSEQRLYRRVRCHPPGPQSALSPPVDRQARRVGIATESISIVIATGLHRACEGTNFRR